MNNDDDGDIRFWEDKWRGDNTFQSDFPSWYALETQKNISLALKLSHDDLLCSFCRAPRAGAEELQYIQLVKIMEGITLFDSKDRWRWSLEGCGEFTVASVRNLLDANSLPVVSSKTRWIKAVPIKVNIHAWKVKLDILPTRLNISKRGMDIESILCPLCEKNVESSSHIFFTCPISREIFRKVLLWWEIDVVMVSSYDEWLEWLLSIQAFQDNSNTIIESLPIFPIPVEDSDSLREEIDIFSGPDDSIPPSIESNDFDSEDDDNSTSLPEFDSFHVDYPDSGDSTINVVEDIPVNVPNILPTHPALLMDFDFIPSHNDLGSDLDISSPSGDINNNINQL
ncbi:RNA-directed DNA polymerase, eukaryota, reverse transcriptase zinc-binding domain protein [Tanacetum coccineum]